MIKRIDDTDDIASYGYESSEGGGMEFVTIPDADDVCSICVEDNAVHVFRVDIPKLIKALQAAYNHNKEV